MQFLAAPLEEVEKKVYEVAPGKCVSYTPAPTSCHSRGKRKLVNFE